MKGVGHIALFALAAALVYFGLAVGLILSPDLGTAMWVAAGVVLVANLWWLAKSR